MTFACRSSVGSWLLSCSRFSFRRMESLRILSDSSPREKRDLWIAAVILASGFALANRSRAALTLAAVGVVLGIFEAERAVRRDTSDPRIQVSYELRGILMID